jgi:glutaredoxin domain-containing cysteine-rich protein 1
MPSNVQAPILEKLNQFETDAPHSWDEVSKALEDACPQ